MKMNSKLALIAGTIGLFSTSVMASHIPNEIYKPVGGKLVKSEQQGHGEYEVKYYLNSQKTNVSALTKKVIAHARAKGFRLQESEIKHHDADLKFVRGHQELNVEIELKNRNRIEYSADLDSDRH